MQYFSDEFDNLYVPAGGAEVVVGQCDDGNAAIGIIVRSPGHRDTLLDLDPATARALATDLNVVDSLRRCRGL